MKGETGGSFPVPLGAPPSLRQPVPGLWVRACPATHKYQKSNQGTGNEINSFGKLLISGEEEKILQLRQGCFIYILGTKNDDC